MHTQPHKCIYIQNVLTDFEEKKKKNSQRICLQSGFWGWECFDSCG